MRFSAPFFVSAL